MQYLTTTQLGFIPYTGTQHGYNHTVGFHPILRVGAHNMAGCIRTNNVMSVHTHTHTHAFRVVLELL